MDPITVGLAILLVLGLVFAQWQFKPKLVKIKQGSALVRRRPSWLPAGGTTVSFTSNYVIKLFDKFEVVDVTAKNLRYDLEGVTADERAFTLKGELILILPREEDNVLAALEHLDSETIGNTASLKELFGAKFRETAKSVAEEMEAEKLPGRMETFRDSVIEKFGPYQNGFQADAAFIDLKIR